MSKNSQAMPFLFAPGNEQYFLTIKGNYQKLMDVFSRQGYDPIFVQPDWDNGTPKQWIEGVVKQCLEVPAPNGRIALGGFSFGAMFMLSAAAQLESMGESVNQPIGVLAASTAPYFKETMPHILQVAPEECDNLSPEVMGQLDQLAFPRVNCPVDLCIGKEEWYYMHYQALYAEHNLPNTTLTVVPRAGHNILHRSYLKAVGRLAGAMALREHAVNMGDA